MTGATRGASAWGRTTGVTRWPRAASAPRGRRRRTTAGLAVLVGLAALAALTPLRGQATDSCEPAVRFGSLLSGLRIDAAGRLDLRRLVAVCLPVPDRPGPAPYLYDPGLLHFVDGWWREYAALWYPRPDRFLQIHLFLRRESTRRQPTLVEADLVRDADGAVLARTDAGAWRLTTSWELVKLSFRPPGSPPAEYAPARVLGTDGAYTVRVRLGGQVYGTYPFWVAGGRITLPDPPGAPSPGQPWPVDAPNTYWLRRAGP